MSKTVHVVRKDGTTFDVDFEGYEFSVIYSVDCVKETDPTAWAPPGLDAPDGPWTETEDDEQYEYDYLEGEWEGGHHRKWCALLTLEQFEEFLGECALHASGCQTMGSLGAPGYGVGWAPAVAFEGGEPEVILGAYVTPTPPEEEEEEAPNWDDVEQAMQTRYKNGSPFPEWEEEGER